MSVTSSNFANKKEIFHGGAGYGGGCIDEDEDPQSVYHTLQTIKQRNFWIECTYKLSKFHVLKAKLDDDMDYGEVG